MIFIISNRRPWSEGAEFKFEELRGARAVLITNVASECGATAANYADFLKVQKNMEARWVNLTYIMLYHIV